MDQHTYFRGVLRVPVPNKKVQHSCTVISVPHSAQHICGALVGL